MRSAPVQSSRESIIRAAFRVFGTSGIESTSLRRVAREAGVSPALVVHHFGGKEGLVAAVDEAAVREFGDAYTTCGVGGDTDVLHARAEQTARVMSESRDVCAYLARALVEGTAGGSGLFRIMIERGRAEIDALADSGALRPGVDRLWATLQHFFLVWAPLSFMSLLSEALEGDLLDSPQLDRWVDGNVELLKGGLYI